MKGKEKLMTGKLYTKPGVVISSKFEGLKLM
jgi:hypothetical protein